MTTQPHYNVLFICEANAGRSLMAEAMLNKMGHGSFNAYSAGKSPANKPHPYAINALRAEGFTTDGLRSKSWDEFLGDNAKHKMDFIITLCDSMREPNCPTKWPGEPIVAHWHFDNPVLMTDEAPELQEHADRVQRELANRIHAFIALPFEQLDRMALHHHIANL